MAAITIAMETIATKSMRITPSWPSIPLVLTGKNDPLSPRECVFRRNRAVEKEFSEKWPEVNHLISDFQEYWS
jgi:hypothetical protein